MKFLILVLMVACSAYANLTCPNYTPMQNFDVTRYIGKWYEVQRLPNQFELFQSCVTAQYSPIDAKTIKVLNSAVFDIRIHKFPVSITGSAVMLDPSTPSVLGVSFNTKKPQTTPNYIVLDTDYETYSLVYTCVIGPSLFKSESKTEYAWFLSREKTLSNEIVEKLTGKLAALGVDVSKLQKITQNCDN